VQCPSWPITALSESDADHGWSYFFIFHALSGMVPNRWLLPASWNSSPSPISFAVGAIAS